MSPMSLSLVLFGFFLHLVVWTCDPYVTAKPRPSPPKNTNASVNSFQHLSSLGSALVVGLEIIKMIDSQFEDGLPASGRVVAAIDGDAATVASVALSRSHGRIDAAVLLLIPASVIDVQIPPTVK